MNKHHSTELTPTEVRGLWIRKSYPDNRYSTVNKLNNGIKNFLGWFKGTLASIIIISILFFIVVNFYIFSSIVNLESFFFIFLLLSLLTDGLYLLIHLPRQKVTHRNLTFSPENLTIIICCYNGQDVIKETIVQAKKHVPAKQIIVVSDASTDSTVKIAKRLSVKVIENSTNISKAFSINKGVMQAKTKYVLLLDDDTLIGETFIPTSLLDEGYSAVAFNVMPIKEKGMINILQQFEYRMSMQLGKNLRGSSGSVGTVSGAIGLYKTEDLINQSTTHSGQFAGEDEQRTVLAQLESRGKGITYTDSAVFTKAPDKWMDLYRQRAYSWSLAVPELFVLYWRLLLDPKTHFLLKAEKAYQVYIYLTDPLRILFFWALILKPSHILITYAFYFFINLVVWLRLGLKDQFSAVVFFPVYSLGLAVCRFIGHFYWLKVKAKYLIKRTYRSVKGRKLLYEYIVILIIFTGIWTTSTRHFANDLSLFQSIKARKLDQQTASFEYEETTGAGSLPDITPPSAPDNAYYLWVPIDKGDTPRAIAHKAITTLSIQRKQSLIEDKYRLNADELLASKLTPAMYLPSNVVQIDKSLIDFAIQNTPKENK